ncbi:MAG: matrixin family metalloprotease [Armatimonadetes bacterium]|nr:matrixin family metalloprotease [Armatimonadota bacterium]
MPKPSVRSQLVQPKVYELLDRAINSYQGGNYNEALACVDLVSLGKPIRVSIDFSGVSPSQKPMMESAIQDAFQGWEDATYGQVGFEFVQGSGDIRIKFEKSVRQFGREVAGFAVWSRQVYDWGNQQYTNRLSGTITLRTEAPQGQNLTREMVMHTAGHEMGHILGLWDSPRVGDIMGPLNPANPVTAPTANEASALMSARSEAVYIAQTAQALAKK